MISRQALDPILDLCRAAGASSSPAEYLEAAEAVGKMDDQRRSDGWVVLEPWQAYAVRQLLSRATLDPCLGAFARAVPDALRPPGMTVPTA